jgi:sulfur relay (sulfurtransferase) DsrF/TusC family protein
MKVLQIVEQAFRTLTEEQDDTILWLTQCMHVHGEDTHLSVLLAGHAVTYAVQQKPQPALTLGDWQQREPADIRRDLDGLLSKGIPVHVLHEDLAARGLARLTLHEGVEVLYRDQLPELYEKVDRIWQW